MNFSQTVESANERIIFRMYVDNFGEGMGKSRVSCYFLSYTMLSIYTGGETTCWLRSHCIRTEQHGAAGRYSSSWWTRRFLLPDISRLRRRGWTRHRCFSGQLLNYCALLLGVPSVSKRQNARWNDDIGLMVVWFRPTMTNSLVD